MSSAEAMFCRSAPWRLFARRTSLPWAINGERVSGDVLEIGAGSGAMAAELLRLEPRIARLTAVDVDPRMARRAAHELLPAGSRAVVEIGDATQLPFDAASFDTVVSWLMLHHTIEWEQVLIEARRVLRPGGLLIGYDILDTAAARAVHRVDRSPHRLFSLQEFRTALNETFTTGVVQPALRGLVCRFRATLPASTAG
jgi:ubiquinone/menaquinone biosynthesis C-methylase UbiE